MSTDKFSLPSFFLGLVAGACGFMLLQILAYNLDRIGGPNG